MVLNQNTQSATRPFARLSQLAIDVLCLCFPAFINRGPLVFPDTRAYFMGGHAAIEKVVGILYPHSNVAAGVDAAAQEARGVRSAFYSLFTYIPAVSVSLWLVIVLQALIVAFMLRLAFAVTGDDQDGWRTTGRIAILSALTTVSWATCNVMPDIFTSIMALGIVITIVYWKDLTRSAVLLLFLAIAGGMVMHMANLPIALGLLAVGLYLHGRAAWQFRNSFMTVAGGVLLGALAMLMVGVVGFDEWSLAPQAPPFLTARSLRDGPGQLYLQEHCPEARVLMCEHLDKLDLPTDKFIWDSDGVYSAVSPQDRARMRAEDKRIYIAAAIDHPWMQFDAVVKNAFWQLITFGVQEYYITSWADYTRDQMTLHIPEQAPWQVIVNVGLYVVVLGALGGIVLIWPRLTRRQKQFVIMVAATVLLESAAGAISEPVARYESRVIWLIPLCALLFWPDEHAA